MPQFGVLLANFECLGACDVLERQFATVSVSSVKGEAANSSVFFSALTG